MSAPCLTCGYERCRCRDEWDEGFREMMREWWKGISTPDALKRESDDTLRREEDPHE